MTIKVYSIDEVIEERTLDDEKIKNIQTLFKFLIGEQQSHLSVKCILPQKNKTILQYCLSLKIIDLKTVLILKNLLINYCQQKQTRMENEIIRLEQVFCLLSKLVVV